MSSETWIDTRCDFALHVDAKARHRWALARGRTLPQPDEFATVVGSGNRFCVHVIGGLEALSAEELIATGVCYDVTVLSGKILFASEAPLQRLKQLRSVELLSLCCWAAPSPELPAASSAEAWLDSFALLLKEQVMPYVGACAAAWQAAACHNERGPTVRFRATVKRGGDATAMLGVTSVAMAQRLGDLCVATLGWVVDLTEYECEVLLHWNDELAVLELPITNRSRGGHGGGEAPISHREYALGTLHPPVCWSLVQLANVQPGDVVCDPMVGKGGLLLEASRVEPTCTCLGFDIDHRQIEAAEDNVRRLSGKHPSYFLPVPVAEANARRLSVKHPSYFLPVAEANARRIPRQTAGGAAEAASSGQSSSRCCSFIDSPFTTKRAWMEHMTHMVVPNPRISLCVADCTQLPLADSSVDVIVTDLPFGRRYYTSNGLGLYQIYVQTIAQIRRVLRDGGTCVLLCLQRDFISKMIHRQPAWLPISRHEVFLSSFKAHALVFRKLPLPRPPPRGLSTPVETHEGGAGTREENGVATAMGVERESQVARLEAAEARAVLEQRAVALHGLVMSVANSRRLVGRGTSTRIPLRKRRLSMLGHSFDVPVRADGESWVASAPAAEVGAMLDAVGDAPSRHRNTMLQELFHRAL